MGSKFPSSHRFMADTMDNPVLCVYTDCKCTSYIFCQYTILAGSSATQILVVPCATCGTHLVTTTTYKRLSKSNIIFIDHIDMLIAPPSPSHKNRPLALQQSFLYTDSRLLQMLRPVEIIWSEKYITGSVTFGSCMSAHPQHREIHSASPPPQLHSCTQSKQFPYLQSHGVVEAS
ncbi:hypothetical protein BGX38DRAFT_373577 [Terfezia claveryi]|nr:hypothetical protein BGX38DRAFT_373577 [Terfezia claveryi]